MDKAAHGLALKRAMASRGLDRQTVADAAGVQVRTVTNWTTGATMPSLTERMALERLFGDYAAGGDPVEVAIRASTLDEWRQDAVLSFYKRNLHEQRAETG